MNCKLSFVIPCYRSEKTLLDVVNEIRTVVAQRESYDYEIVLVSDASPDSVYEIITQLSKEDPRIHGAELARNFGQFAALIAGYRIADGDIIISLDDDGQFPVDRVFELIDQVEGDCDVSYAKFINNTRGSFRQFGTNMNNWMATLLIGKPREVIISSFFAMKAFVKEEVVRYHAAFPYVDGLIFQVTRRVMNVSMTMRPRASGHSGYTLSKMISMWLNGFTAFSIKPLRLATVAGLSCAFLGFLFGIYTIIYKLLYPMTVEGYSSLMAAILFVGGMIMFMLGLLGEYVGRIYICISDSPQYVLRKTTNVRKDDCEQNQSK